MRVSRHSAGWLFAAIFIALTSSCTMTSGSLEPSLSSRFVVKVHCQTLEGRAVAGVLLQSGQGSQRTDARGTADLIFDGKEGDEVTFRIEKFPADLELVDQNAQRRVVLKRYGAEVGLQGLSTVQHDISFRNKKDSYVVLVYAEQAARLPILANGRSVARLNSRGAAAFRYEAKPGEELVVALSTQGEPRASVTDPRKVFKLNDDERLLLFHSDVVISDKAPIQPIKKKATTDSKGPKSIPMNWGKLRRK